jgi:hypothetical protein
MKRIPLTTIALVSLLLLNMPMAMAHTGETIALSGDTHGISIDHGDVIIHNDQGGQARITPAGKLIIDSRNIDVDAQQKARLRAYVSTVQDIETKAVQLGEDAAGFATSVVAEVLTAVFSGEDEDKIDAQASTRAHSFKQKALPICKDVQVLKSIQDSLAASIVAFQPYTIVKDSDAHECEQDILSED